MNLPPYPFQIHNWENVPVEEHAGITGKALWKILRIGDVRVRMVEYLPGYKADHWCSKGHIIHCIKGEMNTELRDGRIQTLHAGETYIVGDDCEAHQSRTENGCVLFIVD